ncbi:siderophore-interacting protein [Dactylosporangium sp. AC04546]|uniref:siderophore-interacting protein n=1 Tax=Dactylosporangium sp. AC04546 TaxID=2862460 RepID=UPI001EDF5971|nr:siderophore-interacting protein [Dactylosporangium sp. AC04546]WVK86874.1 siderophore-interacting protein [Dactylosporangium sp. AC04546]
MPKTSRATTVYPLTLRELQVARIEDVSPWLRRVTLVGDQLGAFTSASGHPQPAFRSEGFDDSVRLHPAYPGETEPVLPVQKDGRLEFGKDPRPLSKQYTVRRFDPQLRELDIDFVRHGTGVATTWAYRAKPGDRLHISGPPAAHGFPAGADWLLVLGDETALPAIARLLDEWPAGRQALVFIEIADDGHRAPLAAPPGVRVTWLPRGGAEAGTTTVLLDAVRDAEWWTSYPGQPYAWLAGETGTVRDLRRYLVEERGLPKVDVEFTGYWKRADVVTLADDPAVPDPDKNPEAFDKLHELAELLPPLALRAAVALDLPDRIARGVATPADLAAQVGADPVAVGKLLRYLHAIEILESDQPEQYRLSPAGDYLLHDYVIEVLHPDGVIARQELAFAGLAESVRTGRAAYASVTGRDFAALRREQWFEDRMAQHVAEVAPYLTAPLAAAEAFVGIERIVVHSDGAGSVAQALTTERPGTRITIVALPSHATWLKADLPTSIPDEPARTLVTVLEQSIFEPSPAADAVLFVKALCQLPDRDAEYALRQAVAAQGPDARVFVVDDVLDPAELDEHEAEADLLNLTLYGSGNRTDAEWRTRFAGAGLAVAATHTVGWGFTLYELTRIN